MAVGNFARRKLQAQRLVSLFAEWLHGCQMYCCVVLLAHRFSVRVGLGWSLKRTLCTCLNSVLALCFLVILRFEKIRMQLSKLNNRLVTVLLSSFQGRVQPLNHIIVLILKHCYLSMWSRQMKCTLL